jgi:hypothetical protein
MWVDERGSEKKPMKLGAGTARCGLRPGRAKATPLQRQDAAARSDVACELLVVEDQSYSILRGGGVEGEGGQVVDDPVGARLG